jgi:hypothetical protein
MLKENPNNFIDMFGTIYNQDIEDPNDFRKQITYLEKNLGVSMVDG